MMSFRSFKRGNNMYEVVKFVYVMIIIFSPFHVAMNFEPFIRCLSANDCPNDMCELPQKPMCLIYSYETLTAGKCICF
ncbi:putative Late nodulin [Medicago truncatula]|uniref:Putative Late nodulin n=1 Tax=Medicago truncatula TaxID=3880 RepID=A0A396GWD9_MEDTR|nr:putative Late nodulin [Medicago truncatula]